MSDANPGWPNIDIHSSGVPFPVYIAVGPWHLHPHILLESLGRFRVIVMQFIDAHAFDVRSVKKTCVHIVHPDGRLIPFDTYNLFYRDDLETRVLAPLRAGIRA